MPRPTKHTDTDIQATLQVVLAELRMLRRAGEDAGLQLPQPMPVEVVGQGDDTVSLSEAQAMDMVMNRAKRRHKQQESF